MFSNNAIINNYMETNNIVLSQIDLKLLETVMLRYGKIVSFDQIWAVMQGSVSLDIVRKRVAGMVQNGWLIRLKKGLYLVVTDISTLGFADVSDLVIAQALKEDAYISFESALQYYGLFDQMLARVDAVTIETTKSYKVQQTTYSFSSIKKELFFGFTQVLINNQKINIAEKEKAVLDMLYFRSSGYTTSLVMEKLTEYRDQFDFKRLKRYSGRFSLTMVRKVGFLLDLIGVDSNDLYADHPVKENSYSKLTSNVNQFNAKWRLYYDSTLIGQTNASTY